MKLNLALSFGLSSLHDMQKTLTENPVPVALGRRHGIARRCVPSVRDGVICILFEDLS